MGIFLPSSVLKLNLVKLSGLELSELILLFQLNKGVTLVDLLTFSADLEAQADQLVSCGGQQSSFFHFTEFHSSHCVIYSFFILCQ